MVYNTLKLKYFIILLLGPFFEAHGTGLAPFVAKYSVEIRVGVKAKANAKIQLSYSAVEDSYQYRSVTQAKGFAKMLRSRPVTQTTQFRVIDNGIRPLAHQFNDGSKKNKRGETSHFDWDRGFVHVTYKDIDTTLELAPGISDRSLLPVAVMHQCPNIESNLAKVVTRGSIRDYRLENLGRETLTTKLGTLETIKIRQFRVGSSRSTVSWVSPKHQCILIRMHQFKDDKHNGTLEIQSLEGL